MRKRGVRNAFMPAPEAAEPMMENAEKVNHKSTILKKAEFGLYNKESIMVHSKTIFYLLQDGLKLQPLREVEEAKLVQGCGHQATPFPKPLGSYKDYRHRNGSNLNTHKIDSEDHLPNPGCSKG